MPGAPEADRNKPQLLGLRRAELAELLEPELDHPYRADQIYEWLYRHGAREFAEMSNLGLELRRRLADRFRIEMPEIAEEHLSADGTRKVLYRLADGATIETVEIPEEKRRTLCLSSQAGCALACTFCVTGYWGAGRNLTVGEIVGQVLALGRDSLARRPNVVFMGMGEPLHNLDALSAALEILGEWISWRRITVSTVGIVPGIDALAAWPRRPNLALSLHAPDDRRRGEIMPINATYPIADLMAALGRYPLERGRRLTIEYLLIREFNDAVADADALAKLLSGLRCKVNLIPLNPDPVLGPKMRPPDPVAVTAFAERLRSRRLVATVRRRRGDDVSAACGQLRAPGREPRGFRRSNVSL